MDEKERIRNMVAAGTLTDAEAERLLGVLDDIDRAEAELDASGEAMEAEARAAEAGDAPAAGGAGSPPAATGPSSAVGPEGAASGPAAASALAAATAATVGGAPAGAAASGGGAAAAAAQARSGGAATASGGVAIAPEGTRWLHVSLLAGDVDITADAGIDRVEMSGEGGGLRLEPAADGYSLRHEGESQGGSWVDRLLTRVRAGDVRIRVPSGYGVDLSVTAGDVDLDGVAYLRGRLTSGNLTARGLEGVDLVTSAGDIDLDMALTEGRHRLRATAGDVDIRLAAGSSVTVHGSVSIGSASVHAPGFDVDRRGIGQHFEGRVGDGSASLEVHVTTGDISMKVRDER